MTTFILWYELIHNRSFEIDASLVRFVAFTTIRTGHPVTMSLPAGERAVVWKMVCSVVRCTRTLL
jgi:hypothetical protein